MRINLNNQDGDAMEVERPFMRWATVTLSEREIALLGYFVSCALEESDGELSETLINDLENLVVIFGDLF